MLTAALRTAICLLGPGLVGVSLPQVPEDPLRGRVSEVLASMAAPAVYEVSYSTYEVLAASALGEQIRLVLAPSPTTSVDFGAVIESLRSATRAIGVSVPRQLEELEKGGVPEYAQESGLLLGGGPMLFQVQHGEAQYAHACVSDPEYFSIVRTRDFDLTYYREPSRLEVSARNDNVMLYTPTTCCFPLPVAADGAAQFLAAPWEVKPLSGNAVEIRAHPGGERSGSVTLVMAGPQAKYPTYCSRIPDPARAARAFTSIMDWKYEGDTASLMSVLHVQQSELQYSVTHYAFENWQPFHLEDEVVMTVRPLNEIIDTRAGVTRRLKPNELPADISRHLVVVD